MLSLHKLNTCFQRLPTCVAFNSSFSLLTDSTSNPNRLSQYSLMIVVSKLQYYNARTKVTYIVEY